VPILFNHETSSSVFSPGFFALAQYNWMLLAVTHVRKLPSGNTKIQEKDVGAHCPTDTQGDIIGVCPAFITVPSIITKASGLSVH